MPSDIRWIEINVVVPLAEADAVANVLIEHGANGIVEENQPPSLNPSSAHNTAILKSYIKKDAAAKKHLAEIKRYLASLSSLTGIKEFSLTTNEIEDEDWNAQWKSFFQPVKVTERIVIKPTWTNYRKSAAELIIELDPGMAFGTGTHQSTRLCIRAIEEIAAHLPDNNDCSLLDVGTGSGILAFAASFLGIPKVVGIDIDYQAVECAKKNAALNTIADKVTLSDIPLHKMEGLFSIIVANILPHTLIDLKADLLSHLAPNGYLILSGILKEKAREVIDEFIKDISFVRETQEDEWSCLVFQK